MLKKTSEHRSLLTLLIIGLLALALGIGSAAPAGASHPSLFGATTNGRTAPSTLYAIDATTGFPRQIGPIGFNGVSGMDFDASGTLFATGFDGAGDHVLITINTRTGAGSLVGRTFIESISGRTVTDISFRNSDGKLFGHMQLQGDLISINTTTGLASLVGFTGVTFLRGAGLAFWPLLVPSLYYASEVNLEILNEGNGVAVIHAPIVYPPSLENIPRMNALDNDPATDILFGSLIDGSRLGSPPIENYLATLNVNSGVATIIGPTVEGLDAIAFGPPITHVGGTTSFVPDSSGSSAGIVLLAGGVTLIVAIIATSAWCTRRHWLGS